MKAVSKKSKQMTVSWGKAANCSQYEVQYSTDKSFKKNVKSVKINGTKTTINKLKKEHSTMCVLDHVQK